MSSNNTDDSGEQHETTSGSTGSDGRYPDESDCNLDRFVRNRYFHGKLMTARDMQLEQEYHTDRLETLAQHATGSGAVCGLSTTVEQSDEESPLKVTVDPGYALDRCGRPVLLDTTAHETFLPDELPDPGEETPPGEPPAGVSVYIRLVECHTEKVPVNGSEDACREDCTYNRVVEDFEISIDQNAPAPKPVHELEFPEQADLGSDGETASAVSSDPELQKMAQTYYEDRNSDRFQHRPCDEDGDPRVFLGFYARNGAEWLQVKDVPRQYVYSNDMLYAAIARHVTDFENPHGVGIEAIEEYVRDKTLKYSIEAFYDVASTYAGVNSDLAAEINQCAVDVITTARDALDGRAFENEGAFATVMLKIGTKEQEIREFLEKSRVDEDRTPLATDESYADYERLTDTLLNVLPTTNGSEIAETLPDGYANQTDVTRLAVIQDQLAEAASWLERVEAETMMLPGGHEVEARIIRDAIDHSFAEADITGFDPGEVVIDRDDSDPDPAVVLTYVEETTAEWNVFGDEMVDFQNPDYPDDEQVVLVSFTGLLDEGYDYWKAADPEDLFHGVLSRSIKFHAFPESRLVRQSADIS